MDKETAAEHLEYVAALQRSLPNTRAESVDDARAAGLTWPEITAILGMTEAGLVKAHKRWEAEGRPTTPGEWG
jgi:hypothetical protein